MRSELPEGRAENDAPRRARREGRAEKGAPREALEERVHRWGVIDRGSRNACGDADALESRAVLATFSARSFRRAVFGASFSARSSRRAPLAVRSPSQPCKP